MIALPEINRRNWKKTLRELDLSKYPSLSKQLVDLRNKIIAKEQLGFSEESMGYARLYKYFDEFSKQINSIYIKTIDYSKFSSRPPMPHQIPGVEFLLKNNRCILGDDMGMAKTSTALYSVLSMEDSHKVLVVTLKTLKYNFAKEISYLDKRFTIVDKKWSEEKFTIIHYDALKKFKKEIYAAGFTILILDEAHKCFTYDTLIQTDKGKLKIGDIVTKKIKANVLSYNNTTSSLEYKPINDRFVNPQSDTTLEIQYLLGQQYLKIECTQNHKIYVVNENRYKPAIEFIGGEKMFVLRKRTKKEIFNYLFVGMCSFIKKRIGYKNK